MYIDSELKINIDTLKIGDFVYDLLLGHGTVIEIDEFFIKPIICKFNDKTIAYYNTGKINKDQRTPLLYTKKPEAIKATIDVYPKEMYVTNLRALLVSTLTKKVVLTYYNDRYITIDKDGVINKWKYAKDIPTSIIQELTIEEIETKLNLEPNTLRIKL